MLIIRSCFLHKQQLWQSAGELITILQLIPTLIMNFDIKIDMNGDIGEKNA